MQFIVVKLPRASLLFCSQRCSFLHLTRDLSGFGSSVELMHVHFHFHSITLVIPSLSLLLCDSQGLLVPAILVGGVSDSLS